MNRNSLGQFNSDPRPERRQNLLNVCNVCGTKYYVTLAIRDKRKTCSNKCAGIYRTKMYPPTVERKQKISMALKGKMPKNIDSIKGWNRGTHGVMKPNSGSFKKGLEPWNKVGLEGVCAICSKTYQTAPYLLGQKKTCSKVCAMILFGREYRGEKAPHYGKPHSEATKQRLREKKLADPNKDETIKKMVAGRILAIAEGRITYPRGSAHPNWNPNKKPRRDTTSADYKDWRKAVFERDNYACQECGDDRGGNLEADHMKSWANYPELRFEVDNGRTLCKDCHKLTPNWGKKVLLEVRI